MSSRLYRTPTGRTFFRPVTTSVVEMYEKERIAETQGMGILSTVGKAALEIGKIVLPEVVGIVGSVAGGYFGAKKGVQAAVPAAVAAQAPIAGAAPMAAPKRIYGYIDPYTGGFVEKKLPKRKKKKKKVTRRYAPRKKKGIIDTDMLMQLVMIKQLGGS